MAIENNGDADLATRYGEFWQYDGKGMLDAYWFGLDGDGIDPDFSAFVEKSDDGRWEASVRDYVTGAGERTTTVDTPDEGVDWCESLLPTAEQWREFETERYIETEPEIFAGLTPEQARYVAQHNPRTNTFMFNYEEMCEIGDAMRSGLTAEQVALMARPDKYNHAPMYNDVQMRSISNGILAGLGAAEIDFITQLDKSGNPLFDDEEMERIELAFEHGMSIDEAREEHMPAQCSNEPRSLAERAAGAVEVAEELKQAAIHNGKTREPLQNQQCI